MENWGQTILIAAVVIVLGWFAFGISWNLRRGNAVLRWMQDGLPQLGERTTLRWLGSSAVEMTIAKPRSPFRQITLLMILEPRDLPWFWLIARAQRRRDMLIIRAQLQTAPLYEFDLVAPHAWDESQRSGKPEAQQWTNEPLDELNFRAPLTTRSLSRAIAVDALPPARQVHPIVWRLSARRDDPQLELHTPLPNLRTTDAGQFFKALRTLGEQMSKRS